MKLQVPAQITLDIIVVCAAEEDILELKTLRNELTPRYGFPAHTLILACKCSSDSSCCFAHKLICTGLNFFACAHRDSPFAQNNNSGG